MHALDEPYAWTKASSVRTCVSVVDASAVHLSAVASGTASGYVSVDDVSACAV